MEVYQGKSDFIVVCFDKDDRNTAEELIGKLNESRLRTWSSERGCNITKKDDAARFAECRTVLILISKDMLEADNCAALLRAAAEQDKALVLLFLGGANFVGRDDLNALLSRSVRMMSYDPANIPDCIGQLNEFECISDCKMAENETPDLKKTGIWDFLNRDL